MIAPASRAFVATALLALLALAATLIGDTLAARARDDVARIAGALSVRVLAPQDDNGLARAVEALRRTPGVISAAAIDSERAAALLESRGGGAVNPAELPPLWLIEVRRVPEIAGDARIERALAAVGVRAELYGARPPAQRDRTPELAEAAAGVAAALLLVLIALSQAGGRDEAGLAADLGAPRGAVLAAHGRAAAATGFAAGLVGAVIVTAGAAGVLLTLDDPLSFDAMISRITASETVLVLLTPLAAAAAAAAGARAGAGRAYDRADRLGA